jgi:hypothetical protein
MDFELKNSEELANFHRKVAHALFMSAKIIVELGKARKQIEEQLGGEGEVDGMIAINLNTANTLTTAVSVLAGMCINHDLIDRGALEMILVDNLDDEDKAKMFKFLDIITSDCLNLSLNGGNDA